MRTRMNGIVSKFQSAFGGRASRNARRHEVIRRAAQSAAPQAATHAAFEPLEDRRLFSALVVNGTGADDLIRVSQTGSLINVNVNGSLHAYPSVRFDSITVNAGAGNDRVLTTFFTTKPLTINGGTGNDYLVGGRGNDTFNGNDGDDVFVAGRGADEYNGGLGVDAVDYSAYLGGVFVSLDDVPNDGTAGEGDNVRSDVENVTGGQGNDTLTGSSADNYLQGGGGTDTLRGLDGNDILDGGIGGAGPASRNNGNDVLYGGNGDDTLYSSDLGNNTLYGEAGADQLYGYAGADNLDGGDGNDAVYGGNNADTVSGGNGDDTVAGGNGDDSVYGNAGADRVFGGDGDDTVDAGSGADHAFGGAGDDTVYGGGGDDYVDGEAGTDKVYGNYGPRTLRIPFPGGLPIDNLPVLTQLGATGAIGATSAAAVTDGAKGLALPTSSFTDGLSNTILTSELSPVVSPLPRIDPTLPIVPIEPPTIDPFPIELFPVHPLDPYVLPVRDLTPRLPQIDPRLVDGIVKVPPVIVIGETDNDVVHGGDGNDRARGDGGNDQVFGDAGDDFVYGDAGDDVVHGGAGDDNVYGGAGDDQLFGDEGDDVLVSIGGGVYDQNTGGAGFDSVWLDDESTEVDNNDFFDALFEGGAGTHHRVGGFQNVTNGTTSQTPSRELNGQSLIDPQTKNGTAYANFSDRPLFGSGGPSKDDIDQGNLADCYYLAGLSAVAKTNPTRIHESVVDLGDGTYAVQFFRNGAPEFYRVDGDLPASNGNPAYQALGHGDALWAAIMEKAFAFRRTGAGTYASIEYGGADAFNVLNLTHTNVFAGNALDTLKNIKAALDSHQAVIAGTKNAIPAGCPCVGNHMYSVESVSLTTVYLPIVGNVVVDGTIVVRNPWHTDGGGNNDGANDGYVTLTASQFYGGFDYARAAQA